MEMNMRTFLNNCRKRMAQGKVKALRDEPDTHDGQLKYADGDYCIVGAGLTQKELQQIKGGSVKNGIIVDGDRAKIERSGIHIDSRFAPMIDALIGYHDNSVGDTGTSRCNKLKKMAEILDEIEAMVEADEAAAKSVA